MWASIIIIIIIIIKYICKALDRSATKLTVAVPAKQVCSPVGDRCDQIMNDVCQQ